MQILLPVRPDSSKGRCDCARHSLPRPHKLTTTPVRCDLGMRRSGQRKILACFHDVYLPSVCAQSGSGQSRNDLCQFFACCPHSFGTTMCGSYCVHADSPVNDMSPVDEPNLVLRGEVCIQPPSVPAFEENVFGALLSAIASFTSICVVAITLVRVRARAAGRSGRGGGAVRGTDGAGCRRPKTNVKEKSCFFYL